jgi:zinc-binding alcohol dehydrogenase family protein
VFGPPADKIIGWDVSGVIVEQGKNVEGFKVGDEVYFAGSLTRRAGFAEFTTVDFRVAAKKPTSLSHAEAAALPLTSLTAWESIEGSLGAQEGKENKAILIIGGAGGVGSIATSLAAKVFKFDRIVTTASRPETVEYSKQRGATHVINHHKDLEAQLKENGGPVDSLFCTANAGPSIAQWPNLLNFFGKSVFISAPTEGVNLGAFMGKNLTISGEIMFASTLSGDDQKMRNQGRILKRVAELVDAKEITTTANSTHLGWESLDKAIAEQDSGKAIGKIVIDVQKK